MALGVTLTVGQAQAQTPSAHWTFDQGSGSTATDSSGNNRTASLTGPGATWTPSSKVGPYALSLSGSSFVRATSRLVNTSGSFTAAAWVKLNSLDGFHGILSKDGTHVSSFFLEYHGGAQRFSFARFASDDADSPVAATYAIAAPVAGTWYHVAGVHNASTDTLTLYVNGVLQQSVSYASGWQAWGSTVIGRTKWNATPVSYLQGSIDDARFYTSALTQPQIQTLVNMGKPSADFALSANPSSLNIAQYANRTTTIAISKLNGFSGSVALSATGLPNGVSAMFNPSSTTGTSSTLTLSVGATVAGTYPVTVRGVSGSLTRTTTVNLTVSTGAGAPYTWPAYSPNLNYDFRTDPLFQNVSAPTTVLNDCANVVGTVTSGWWCFRYGPNKNPLVTAAAWDPMLAYFNEWFDYYRNEMGWPPDRRAQNGYFSSIYLYGSGLCTDNAANTAKGGWQSGIHFNGVNWPMALLSYYPVYSFDPACPFSDRQFQMDASIHEGIHCIMASMPGARQAGWYHESGNTWLQGEAQAKITGNYSSMGWLSAGTMLAPFMPIECYTGWLQDGSFGGPSAEGVNMHNSTGQQICTWRKLLGGVQYGECFAHFLGEIVSPGAVAWTWRYCPGRILQGLAESPGGLGAEQTRRLITEFRARQAMCDFGKWTPAYKKLLTDRWLEPLQEEWSPYWIDVQPWNATCYVSTTNSGGTLIPSTETLPGWSGANQIPLTVSGTGTINVNFQPIGANMQCVLVYRATDNSVVYSKPVASGTCSLTLTKPVKNNVVIAVICNTDYIYEGEATRKAKFDYRLTPGSGVTGTASITTQWFN